MSTLQESADQATEQRRELRSKDRSHEYENPEHCQLCAFVAEERAKRCEFDRGLGVGHDCAQHDTAGT